jgi:hypothetical protein
MIWWLAGRSRPRASWRRTRVRRRGGCAKATRINLGSPAGEWFEEPLWRAMPAWTKGVGAARAAAAPPPPGEVVFWPGRPGRKSDLPRGPLRLHRGLREARARAGQFFSHNNECKTSD